MISKLPIIIATMDYNIKDLSSQALKGDKRAEKRLFEYFRVRFVIIAKLRVGGDEAEDIVQDTCLTIVEKLRDMSFPPNIDAWALNILRNKIGNYYQRQSTRSRVGSDIDVETFGLYYKRPDRNPSLYTNLQDCMKKLIMSNKLFARTLNLAYQGYKSDDICQRLSIKPGHFYVILGRSRQQLKQCLERSNYDYPKDV